MTLSQEDREWIKLVSRELIREVTENIILEHIRACPHGRSLLVSRWFLVGLSVGCGMCGGGIGFSLAKAILGVA